MWAGSRIGFRLDGLTLKRAVACLLLLVGSMSFYKAVAAPVPAHAAHVAVSK
jgi:hypothetical protein